MRDAMTPRREREDMIESADRDERIAAMLRNEPIDKTLPKDPIEPTEKAEPTDPIERNDLCDAMLSVESVEAMLQRDFDMCPPRSIIPPGMPPRHGCAAMGARRHGCHPFRQTPPPPAMGATRFDRLRRSARAHRRGRTRLSPWKARCSAQCRALRKEIR